MAGRVVGPAIIGKKRVSHRLVGVYDNPPDSLNHLKYATDGTLSTSTLLDVEWYGNDLRACRTSRS